MLGQLHGRVLLHKRISRRSRTAPRAHRRAVVRDRRRFGGGVERRIGKEPCRPKAPQQRIHGSDETLLESVLGTPASASAAEPVTGHRDAHDDVVSCGGRDGDVEQLPEMLLGSPLFQLFGVSVGGARLGGSVVDVGVAPRPRRRIGRKDYDLVHAQFGQSGLVALDWWNGNRSVLMDADLEDEPENIPTLVRTLQEQRCDIVYTTKLEGQTTARSLTSDAYHQVFSRTVGVSVPRHLGTFRAFTRKVGEALRAFPERDVLYGPLMFYVGFRSVVVPVARGVRPGQSSYTLMKRLRLAINSLVTYSDLAPKLFASAGVLMIVGPLLYGVIVLLQYLIGGRSLPQGLTMIVLLITFLGGTIMLSLGVLGVYVFFALARDGRDFRLRSRWMLVLDGASRLTRRLRHVVIEHEHDVLSESGEVVEEGAQRSLDLRLGRFQHRDGIASGLRHCGPQRRRDVRPEPRGIVVIGIQRQPRRGLG